MASKKSLRGRRLGPCAFPSPSHEPLTFISISRCLIDLGQTLVVLTEGTDTDDTKAELAYQKTLYRLELQGVVERDTVPFADETCLTEDECEQALLDEMAKFPFCQIVGVEFPKFDRINMPKVIYRPSLALYSENEGPALCISIFMGKPRAAEAAKYDWEIYLKGKEDLGPSTAPVHIVDVSKICAIPAKYNLPGTREHGKDTWDFFKVMPTDSRSALFALDPAGLREKVINTMVSMLRANPLSYTDTTLALDDGLWMTSRERDGDEWVIGREKYSFAAACRDASY